LLDKIIAPMLGFFLFWRRLIVFAAIVWCLAVLFHFPCNCGHVDEALVDSHVKEDWSLQLEGIDYFLQITDIHLDPKLEENSKKLSFFRHKIVPAVEPKAVLVTGDLTNGKKDTSSRWLDVFLGQPSSQRFDEWSEYYTQTQEYRHRNASLLWTDVRGNHDSFGVDDMLQDDDLFQRYAVEPQPKNAVEIFRFWEQNHIKLVKYSPYYRYALHRPFHFFARTSSTELQLVMQSAMADERDQVVILYGHFPSSTIDYTVSESFWTPFFRFFWWSRSIFSHSFCSYPNYVFYISGHLHSALGLLPQMYCRCGSYVELELSDMFTSSVYRWIVIDHGNFAFADIPIEQNIFAVVTNPISITSSTKRSQQFALSSKYIRLLVACLDSFWDRNLTHGFMEVFIDDTKIGIAEKTDDSEIRSSSASHLLLCSWNPAEYLKGFHYLVVRYCSTNSEQPCITIINTVFTLQPEHASYYYSSFKRWVRCLMLFVDAPVVIKGLCFMGLVVYGILVHIPYFSPSCNWLFVPISWIIFGKRFSFVRKLRWRLSQILFYNLVLGPLLVVFKVTSDEYHECTGYFSFFYTFICGERQAGYLEMYNLLLQQLWFGCIPTICLDIFRCFLNEEKLKNVDSFHVGTGLERKQSYYGNTIPLLVYSLVVLYQLGVLLRYIGCYGFWTCLCSPLLSLVFLYCCWTT